MPKIKHKLKSLNKFKLKRIFVKYKLEYVIYMIALIFILMLPNCAKTPEQKQLIKAGKKTLKVKLEGVVKPYEKMKILAPETGTVKKIYVQNASWVKKGDIIYEIYNEELDVRIKALKAQIADINKNIYINRRNSYRIIQSRAELIRVAKTQLERISGLYAEGYATKYELESAEEKYFRLLSEKENIKENYTTTRNNMYKEKRAKEVELAKLVKQQKNSKVYATATGYLTGFSLNLEQTVTKDSIIGQIINLNKVIVRAGIASGLFQFIHKNDIVQIDFITTPPYSRKTRITRIIPIVDPKIGRMVVEMELDNPNYILQDGTKALITLIPSKEAQARLYQDFYKKGSNIVEIRTDIK